MSVTTKKRDEFITVPRENYEDLLAFKLKHIKEVKLTPLQKKAINKARKEFAEGNYVTLDELERELGIRNS